MVHKKGVDSPPICRIPKASGFPNFWTGRFLVLRVYTKEKIAPPGDTSLMDS